MTKAQLENHLLPIAQHPQVEKIWLVRHVSDDMPDVPKMEYVAVTAFRPFRYLQMFRVLRRILARDKARAIVCFNPTPYGFVALAAAYGLPVKRHLGFIGTDWYHRVSKSSRRRKLLAKSDWITATGDSMRKEMLAKGFSAETTSVLPNAIDTDRFKPSEREARDIDGICVCRLVEGKSVGDILKAWSIVVQRRPHAMLCVLGDGPERARLEHLAQYLGLSGNVTFQGHVDDVHPFLERSRLFVFASGSEGMPFALVEAACTGLVPVVRGAGCIADYVKNGENGYIVDTRDSEEFAGKISFLLENDSEYERMKRGILLLREELSIERAAIVWSEWFLEERLVAADS